MSVMLLVISAIFAFIWAIAVDRGFTFSGFIHVFLIASVLLAIAHCWLPNRAGVLAQSCPDPRQQRRTARLLGWRPRKR